MGLTSTKTHSTVYEVWTQGRIGLNKNKPVLYGIYHTKIEAHQAMFTFLEQGKFATIKEITKRIYGEVETLENIHFDIK